MYVSSVSKKAVNDEFEELFHRKFVYTDGNAVF